MAVNLQKQQGFILAATLWALAVMFIVVGIFHAFVERKMALGLQAKSHIEQTLDNLSTEQTVLYWLGTSRMTVAGLTLSYQRPEQYTNEEGGFNSQPVGDEIWLDGTVYQGKGEAHFAIQDNTGLVSLNGPDTNDLTNLITPFEPNVAVRTQLMGALQDYIDADDLLSLAGAEKQDYLARGMLPPTNDYLRSNIELWRVFKWSDWLIAHPQFDVQNWLNINRMSILNLNTMPKTLLMHYLGLSEALSEQLIHERTTNPFRSVDDFILRTNLPINLNEEKYRFFPSNNLRLSFWNKGGGQARLISLQLTPNGLLGPWQVDYEYSVQSVNNTNEPLALRQTTFFGYPLGSDR